MADSNAAILAKILRDQQDTIVREWVRLQEQNLAARNSLLKAGELNAHSRELIATLTEALATGSRDVDTGREWSQVRDLLARVAQSRAKQGFTPTETATFIFSLKQPLFATLRSAIPDDPNSLADVTWDINLVLDRLGLYSTETYQQGREEVINRQQQELLELSTPVVQLWAGVLALPLIGTLDSARTQVVMETLLQAIVTTGSSIAIIDITGVPIVDTLVAQHLLKTVAAARLMGADCIISGIRPQIAQTIVHLGVDIADVLTKATLADAFAIALSRVGLTVTKK